MATHTVHPDADHGEADMTETRAAKQKQVARRAEDKPLFERLGEVDLNDHIACALLLDEVRQFEAQLASATRLLTQASVDRARAEGVSSFELPGRMRAEVRAGTRTTYAAEVLEQQLRRAGMPEERIREIVLEEVVYKVDAREAKKAARMNPEYARALEQAATTHEETPSETLRRR